MKKIFLFFFIILSSISSAEESAEAIDLNPKSIAVEKVISDTKIQQRLTDILIAVGHYQEVKIDVTSGVVILDGLVKEDQQGQWAYQLAKRMDGVVAVKNQIKTRSKEILDLAPAREEIESFNIAIIDHLPTIIMAMSVLAVSIFFFFLTSFGFRRILSKKISSPLLLNASAKMLSIHVFILGLYLALRISGLAGLAFTVLGGTGLLGLAIGLGLKNSIEDYAASILLSIKKPFRPSDWVKIGDKEGIVQKVTSRSTLLIDFSGNHILIPNTLVYKSVITNMTANPKMRCDFVFGLDYDDQIEKAQLLIMDLLAKTDLILRDPEPWVLVDGFGDSSINLRVYFWLNAREVSTFKVTGHIILEIKNLLLSNGFRFPDPNREVVFTNYLPTAPKRKPSIDENIKDIPNKSPRIEEVRAEAFELNRQSLESDLPDQRESVL